MANVVGQIGENTVEDFIDEGISNLVYGLAQNYWQSGFTSNPTESLDKQLTDAWNEALEGAEQTLKYSIMNAVIFRVTEYLMTRLLIAGAGFYAYVKSGGIIKKIKDRINGISDSQKFKGKKGYMGLQTMIESATGTEQERLKLVGMANDTANNIGSAIMQERQTATMQVSQQRKQIMTSLGLSQGSKGLNDKKKLEAYNLKMKTGTWSIADKKLFYDCVPKQYLNGLSFNQSFLDKLNSYSEYAKTTENRLVNLAQVHLDKLTSEKIAKI